MLSYILALRQHVSENSVDISLSIFSTPRFSVPTVSVSVFRIGRGMQHFKTFMFHTVVQRVFLCSYCKKFDTTLFLNTVYMVETGVRSMYWICYSYNISYCTMWYTVRWPLFEQTDDAVGSDAAHVGITKSCSARPAATSCCTASGRSETEQTTTSTPAPPVDESQTMSKPKRWAGEPPRWFKTFVDEERKKQEEWKEELRGYFQRSEHLQTKRLKLLKEAVGRLSDKWTTEHDACDYVGKQCDSVQH